MLRYVFRTKGELFLGVYESLLEEAQDVIKGAEYRLPLRCDPALVQRSDAMTLDLV